VRRLAPVLFVAAAALAATALAQPLPAVGYVDSQYLISIHPAYPRIVETRELASSEIGQVAATIQELQARQQAGQTLTPEEQERLQVSIQTLRALEARYDAELQALAQPAIDAVNAAIAQVAADLDIGLVLDATAARETGLVVWASPGNDLTPLVEQVLRESF